MNVHRCTDVREFYTAVGAYLERREAEHNVQLGMLNTWLQVGVPTVYDYLLLYAVEGGEVQAVATHIKPYRVVLSTGSAAGVQALADFLIDHGRDLSGVMGLKTESRLFAERWAARTGGTHKINRAERIFRLDTLIPSRPASGAARRAGLDDLTLLADWLYAFETEADPDPPSGDRASYEQQICIRLLADPKVRGLRVWVDDGQPVCMVGYSGPTGNSIRVGPVYTPPEKRGRGYAGALTAAVTEELLDMGYQFVTLFTDLSNPTSNSIYQKLGYKPVCDVDEYAFTLQREGG